MTTNWFRDGHHTDVFIRAGEVVDKYIGMMTITKPIRCHDDYHLKLISLGMPIKKIFNIEAKDVLKFKIPTNVEPQINITGTATEIKTLLKAHKIEEWKKKGVKVIFKHQPLET